MIDLKIIVPWFLTAGAALIGVWQYADKQAQLNREPFLREQLALVLKASESVSKIATLTDVAEWEEARADFWVLYWGPLAMVENVAVERCMVAAHKIIPRPGEPVPVLPLRRLESSSLALAHAARDLVLDSWNVSLPPIEGRQSEDGIAANSC